MARAFLVLTALPIVVGLLLAPPAARCATMPDSQSVSPSPPFVIPDDFSLEGQELTWVYKGARSDVWVVGTGVVDQLLDDAKSPPRQRFVVRADRSGEFIRVEHPIDDAPRISVQEGDRIAFRGKYVWKKKTGILQRTRRDTKDKHGGGWIVNGKQAVR